MVGRMRAMVLEPPAAPRKRPMAVPEPRAGQVLVKVAACRRLPHRPPWVDGELPDPKLPRHAGYEIVGTVVEAGSEAGRFKPGRPHRHPLARLYLRTLSPLSFRS